MATKETTVLISTSTIGTVTSRRRPSTPKAGSVWESRMKLDQVKGGIKVLDQNNSEQDKNEDKKVGSNIGFTGKRKTWKSENTSYELSPVQIVRKRSELVKKFDEKKTRSANRSINGKLNSALNGEKFDGNLESLNLDGNLKRLDFDESVGEIEKEPIGIKKSTSDEAFGECEEKCITSDLENVEQIKAQFEDKVVGSEVVEVLDEEKEIKVEIEKKSVDVKEVSLQEQRQNKTVIEKKKLLYSNEIPVPFPSTVKQQTPVVNHSRVHQIPAKIKPECSNGIPRTHKRLQSLVDLIMWRDISRSAFVFGIGTFFIISSSVTNDLNISFLSLVSYLSLVYLAAIFTFRTLIKRGSVMGTTDQDYGFGEEEAFWLIKLFLPYVNEFLLNLRALFYGDPATTMKLAVILYILARCGGSITIWKLAKLGFFGVFTIPKICASYSSQLTSYGKFWIQRFGDAWESCSHKKAVGFAIFTLVWNFSSVVARIWAVFMLFVAFKFYQQSLIREGLTQQEATSVDASWKPRPAQNNGGRKTTSTEIRKQKKPC